MNAPTQNTQQDKAIDELTPQQIEEVSGGCAAIEVIGAVINWLVRGHRSGPGNA